MPMPAPAPPAKKPIYKGVWFWMFAVVVIGVIAAASSTSKKSGDDSSGSHAKSGSPSCGTKATDGCAPTVGPDGTVRVDALEWDVRDVDARKTIGDRSYGLGAKADGVFVVVKLHVHSHRDQSATLTDNVFQLETPEGNTYDPSTEGTTAAMGAGEQPFFLQDIGPDADHIGKVVFDVPPTKLGGLKMRFNEIGLGPTHGYIRLPALS